MKNEQKPHYGVTIERGWITEKTGSTYTVESYDRPGVTAWGLKSMEQSHSTGDKVYFFVFPDGGGLILRKI